MVYADYTYYKETYLGTLIPESEFPMLAKRASEYLDYITVGKASENASMLEIKDACCALSEQYKVIEKAQESSISETGEKSSETVGSYSVRCLPLYPDILEELACSIAVGGAFHVRPTLYNCLHNNRR